VPRRSRPASSLSRGSDCPGPARGTVAKVCALVRSLSSLVPRAPTSAFCGGALYRANGRGRALGRGCARPWLNLADEHVSERASARSATASIMGAIASVRPASAFPRRRRCASVASTSSSASEISAGAKRLPTRGPRTRPNSAASSMPNVGPGMRLTAYATRRAWTPPARPCSRRIPGSKRRH
jgi:hypothetical protein